MLSLLAGLLLGCPAHPAPSADDAGIYTTDLGILPITVGLGQDCAPAGAGYGDTVCSSGLRCGLIMLGDGPVQGALTQCVPLADNPLAEDQPCAFDQQLGSPTEPLKHYDRCADGLACVPTPAAGLRCKRPCQIRMHGSCHDGELCVIPSPVSGIGYCAPPDHCQPVAPQSGCATVDGGPAVGCYVLGDDKNTDTACVAMQPYGQGSGAYNTPCDRSWNCQPNLGCVAPTGHDSFCRPYCALPTNPDGGPQRDLGGDVYCPGDLGLCNPIQGYSGVGRCY
jgi:hypothetical protein